MYDPMDCDRGNSVRPYRVTMVALYDPIYCDRGSSVRPYIL